MTTLTLHSRRTLVGLALVVSGLLVAAAVTLAQGTSFGQPGGAERSVYQVEIDGISLAQFQEVSGLSMEREVVEFREGGDTGTIRKLPGRLKFGDITLKRGLMPSDELWHWFQQTMAGVHDPRNGTIVILGRQGEPIARYKLHNAWPAKWVVSVRQGQSSAPAGTALAIESIVLATEGIEREEPREAVVE